MSDRAGRGPLRAARFARGTGVLRAHPPFAGHRGRPPGSDGRDTGAANGGHDPIADLRHHARTAGGTGRRAHPRFRFAASVPRWRAQERLPGIGVASDGLSGELGDCERRESGRPARHPADFRSHRQTHGAADRLRDAPSHDQDADCGAEQARQAGVSHSAPQRELHGPGAGRSTEAREGHPRRGHVSGRNGATLRRPRLGDREGTRLNSSHLRIYAAHVGLSSSPPRRSSDLLARDDRLKPEKAIPAAAMYLAGMEQRYGGRDWAIWAYHCGEGCVADFRAMAKSTKGLDDPPASVAKVFFGCSPVWNRELCEAIHTQMDRDYSPTYWFRVMRAEQLLRMYRDDPVEFRDLAAEYKYSAAPAQRAPDRLSAWLKPQDLIYETGDLIRNEEGSKLVSAPDAPEFLGYRVHGHTPPLGNDENDNWRLKALPSTIGTLAYIAFETRRLYEALRPGETFVPLAATALVLPKAEGGSAEGVQGARMLDHASGQVFDLSASGLPPGEWECLQFVLDDLGWNGSLGFIEEPPGRQTMHIGCSPSSRDFFAQVFEETQAALRDRRAPPATPEAVVNAGLPLNDLGRRPPCCAAALAIGLSALSHVAAIVLGFRGLDVEWGGLRQIVEEGEDLFVLFRSQVLRCRRPSRRNQKEHAPELRANALDQPRNLAQAADIVPGDGGVHLSLQANSLCMFQRENRTIEGTVDTAESVVAFRVRPIEADCHPGQSTVPKPFDGTLRQQWSCARSHGGSQPQAHALLDQREQVRPLQRVAASENHQWVTEGADFLKQAETFLSGQF